MLKFRNYKPSIESSLVSTSSASLQNQQEEDGKLPFELPDQNKPDTASDDAYTEDTAAEDSNLVAPPRHLEESVEKRLKEIEEEDPLKDIENSTVDDVLSVAPRKVDWCVSPIYATHSFTNSVYHSIIDVTSLLSLFALEYCAVVLAWKSLSLVKIHIPF